MSDWPIHINRIEIDAAASASSYGCRKSSERMKWVSPTGDFPVASEKLSRDWMIDQGARSKTLKLNWLPILFQRYSNSFPWEEIKSHCFRRRFCGFPETIDWFYDSESIEIAKALTFRNFVFWINKVTYASVINPVSINDYNRSARTVTIIEKTQCRIAEP